MGSLRFVRLGTIIGAALLLLPLSGMVSGVQTAHAARPQCSDGIDNDADGAIDYPADFSCSSPLDNDESIPKTQCQDGKDNDGDDLIDIADPGCHVDGNGSNPASYNPQKNDESNGVGTCSDTFDNDGDTFTDAADPDCHRDADPRNPASYDGSRTEHGTMGVTNCEDGQDNDGDGYTDFPQDSGCTSPQDNTENNKNRVSLDITESNAQHVAPGEILTYTLALQNTGTTGEYDMRIQQNLPPGVTFVSATEGGYNRYDGIIMWPRITVNGRSAKILTLTARVSARANDGQELKTIVFLDGREAASYRNIVRVGGKIDGGFVSAYPGNAQLGNGNGVYLPGGPYTPNNAAFTAGPVPYYTQQTAMVQPLPRTGIEDFTGALEDTSRFLTPLIDGSTGSLPAAFWSFVTLSGLGIGGFVGKKKFVM